MNEIHRHIMKPFIIECGIIHNRLQALVSLLSLKWLPPVGASTMPKAVSVAKMVKQSTCKVGPNPPINVMPRGAMVVI